jgi:hypothetical protein
MTSLIQPALVTRLGFDPNYLPEFEDKLFIMFMVLRVLFFAEDAI